MRCKDIYGELNNYCEYADILTRFRPNDLYGGAALGIRCPPPPSPREGASAPFRKELSPQAAEVGMNMLDFL